ncbi:pantoate--beta-alanine ligase [Bacillus shivajii]|uniref:pantoate--beta-alanine ligase n=1 Tax=Bacillus shivajii TaxID=1983719 RepID=UPI001CF9D379|nr:pantoate--beta-alanine ligase [Bacillus shivajii]UCZ54807.1 pantoate--beta-alanine ligase [Bacillus shivajii]
MIVITKINELQNWIKDIRQTGREIGFVPTMGYLHEGHLSLMEKARQQNDVVIASIFVNPLQFGEGEDFDEYPRDLERDKALAKDYGVDVLFVPSAKEMYQKKMSASLIVHEGVDILCGESRPGHFDGVATVVMKLFQLTKPTRAYFGMKDAQQVAVIERMVEDFHLDVEIIRCPTVREDDGLAKSSRNVNLTQQERKEAPKIYALLNETKQLILKGQITFDEVKSYLYDKMTLQISGSVDYIECRTFPELKEVTNVQSDIIIATAVKYSHVRLIDNALITTEELTEHRKGNKQHV